VALFGATVAVGCSSNQGSSSSKIVEGLCQISSDTATEDVPDALDEVGCTKDFEALASQPIDAAIPGARSMKVVLDMADADHLHFQNSQRFEVHYEYISADLSGGDLPVVPTLAEFNTTEYYGTVEQRRFLLGAVTWYEGPQRWTLEIAPYDTATAEMITRLYQAVTDKAFFGPGLAFHPTSDAVAKVAEELKDIPLVTTDELYAGTQYQPLSLGKAVGKLHLTTADKLSSEYLDFRDIVVLDEAPNDISAVVGIITQEFQTPLSHVNVLCRNRHTPNMGLREALSNEELLDLEGQWVTLTVAANEWSIEPATQEEADAWWEANRPDPITLPAMDLTVTDVKDIEDVTPEPDGVSLRDAIKTAVNAFGGKAAQYSILAKTPDVPTQKAFAIPIYYYDKFMRDNGFYARVEAMLADSKFTGDASVRDAELQTLRDDMMVAEVDADLQTVLKDKLAADFPGKVMRFRTSTNSEDLDGFPCAGCYESHSGDPADWNDVLDAIRESWSSAWLFRTFEERSYYGVDHEAVGMALLVHRSFPAEEANGVAITNNPYSQLEPAFYVNVQWGGDAEVVHPPDGITSDQYLHFFGSPGQPISYISHSNLVPDGETVLTSLQSHQLGVALDAINTRFAPAYGTSGGWWAMDVEFKFDDDDDPTQAPALWIKQARPYPAVTSDL